MPPELQTYFIDMCGMENLTDLLTQVGKDTYQVELKAIIDLTPRGGGGGALQNASDLCDEWQRGAASVL